MCNALQNSQLNRVIFYSPGYKKKLAIQKIDCRSALASTNSRVLSKVFIIVRAFLDLSLQY